jgi:CRISPR-associated helicase Cas3/CRISPR-associated endonuclease Cas3-HD
VEYLAHSPNDAGRTHGLADHLQAVAELAAGFAAAWGGECPARTAGLLHDLGKYGDLFKRRLQGLERGIDHWSVGAWEALQRYKWGGIGPALAIQGHHRGLQQGAKDSLSQMDPQTWDARHPEGPRLSDGDVCRLLERFGSDGLALDEAAPEDGRSILRGPDAAGMVEARMLFSALVDADFLDTEAHFQGSSDGPRYREAGPALDAAHALAVLTDHLRDVSERSEATAEVNEIRATLLAACLQAAERPPGVFTLTAPTGSGKTLAMLAFALRHAVEHGLRRVVVVIPYLTIIEQTVRVYRAALTGGLSEEERLLYVLEDHSLAGTRERPKRDEGSCDHPRLLAENWDAPIVVTTSLQMLESLFANRPRACRKLHRLARSVILFDEVQTLPTRLAVPTLATLSHLAARYRATVVFSTATQPAFGRLDSAVRCHCAAGWRPEEIAPAALGLFERARRTSVEWPDEAEARTAWPELADRLGACRQALCIVNLKRHAVALFEELKQRHQAGLYHLSTSMCPAHRQATLDSVRQRLRDGEPCVLVSTQCVEAGVDVDFPEVFRAWGPLDAIAQAAGRCNRNGRLPQGTVHVFVPEEPGRLYPDRAYEQGADVTRSLLSDGGPAQVDINDPATFDQYYGDLYGVRGVGEGAARDALADAIFRRDFVDVAAEYRLIEQDAINVLVPYCPETFRTLREEVCRKGLTREWVLRARPHTVSLFRPRGKEPLCRVLLEVTVGRRGEPSGDWFIYQGEEVDYSQEMGLVVPPTMPLWSV